MSSNIENNKHLKENPFRVPDGYFEESATRFKNIAIKEKHVIPISPENTRFSKKYFSIAAAFVLLITATWYFALNNPNKVEDPFTEEDYYSLIENGAITNFETNFINTITLDELDNLVLEESVYTFDENEYSTDDLEEMYLYNIIY